MFKRIFSKYRPILYIQISESRVVVSNVKTGDFYDDAPLVAIRTKSNGEKVISAVGKDAKQTSSYGMEIVNPFSHPRVLFSDFYVGERFLQYAIHKLLDNKFVAPSPRIIIHPQEKLEGGLTMIENRALRELGFGAGASDVIVYTGRPLSLQEIDYEELKAEDDGISPERQSLKTLEFVVIILLIIVSFSVFTLKDQ